MMTELSLVIAIISICVMISIAISAWNRSTRWVAFILIPILAVGMYLGWEASNTMLGKPLNTLPDDEWILVGSTTVNSKEIYLLVQPIHSKAPIFIKMSWTKERSQMLAQAFQAMCKGSVIKGKIRVSDKDGRRGKHNDGNSNDSGDDSPDMFMYEFTTNMLPGKDEQE